jgi:hypothetical protein
VAEAAGRHLDAGGAARLGRQRIDGERVLRVHRFVAGRRNACVTSSSTSLLPLPSTICSASTS